MMPKGYFDWKRDLKQLHNQFPSYEKRPLIGITGNFGSKGCELAQGYFESVLRAGGTPLIIPPYENADALLSVLDHLDGILLSGGGDLNPLFLGQEPSPALHGICPERDKMELMLVQLAYHRQIPMLGICRGIQLMVTALEGELYQDLGTEYKTQPLIKHNQDLAREYASHTAQIEKDSMLSRIMGTDIIAVNSFHHQAVKNPGPHLRVAAQAPDGVIEAVESTEYKSILGVQWHPECFIMRQDETMMPIFRWLTEEANLFAEAKNLHKGMLSLDSHCDTPMFFHQKICFNQRDPRILVDLHKMTEGHLDASIMVAYIPQKERDEASLIAANIQARQLLSQIQDMVSANQNAVGLACTPEDLFRLKAEGKKAIMRGIENGYAIGKDISQIETFRKMGVVYMTLCHNGDNDICDSARGKGEHNGVSPFGTEVIREMNRVGMMVDLSHASEKSFYDALDISRKPIVCSHSSARALCDHPRNLTDEQMKALASKDGVAQVTLYHGFLCCEEEEATIHDAVAHLCHMVDIMGIEHVGIGTDFDGDGGVLGFADASESINFTRQLLQKHFSPEEIRLIWGGNFLRVMKNIQSI